MKEVLQAVRDIALIWFLASRGHLLQPPRATSKSRMEYDESNSLFFGSSLVFVANVEVESEGRSVLLLAIGVGARVFLGKFAFSSTLDFLAFGFGLENLQSDETYIFELTDIVFEFIIFLFDSLVFCFELVISLQ